ncbi:MAG TPA: bifunctional phosphoribosylaminoimidazolecarboxamide formyltransferase/IMP cyclohydrolase PurH [Porphyromonadaceae bacterium]|nr:bifunctional phosphoribosylaminoimidazolecarboxamide formyltransferase/IMP cyclohydrolase PurH [Porphyromonadaceae bacterium]
MKAGLKIRRALLSVSDKNGVVELGRALHAAGTELIATGNTAKILREAELPITPIEEVSGSPEAFQGRMKTLSFPVFSGILHRRGSSPASLKDLEDLRSLGLGPIDCVIVNFYPFEKTAARTGITRPELIEEIDIGGPSLVRAAAKNSPDVLVLTSPAQYSAVIAELGQEGMVSCALAERCAAECWDQVLAYDSAIASQLGAGARLALRYGENPHQKGYLSIDADSAIAWPRNKEEQLTPAELSYNNILDISAAYGLTGDLLEIGSSAKQLGTGVVIVKHGNPCGCAWAGSQLEALERAWEGDPVSAFGGIVVTNRPVDKEAAAAIHEIFFEVIIAPAYDKEALDILFQKKNRIILVLKSPEKATQQLQYRSVLNGMLVQDKNESVQSAENLQVMTQTAPGDRETQDLLFANILVKHTKSNAIVLAKDKQLIASGTGQTSRVDALKQAIEKAAAFHFDLQGAVMASDAFFPFPDCVEIAHQAGITAVIQPGGSIRDTESVAYCDQHGLAMVTTGVRHFKH